MLWRYGVSGRTEADREAGRFFVANTEYPITDPWRRPLCRWTLNDDTTEHEWLPCDEPENIGYSYRYASVQKKLVKTCFFRCRMDRFVDAKHKHKFLLR